MQLLRMRRTRSCIGFIFDRSPENQPFLTKLNCPDPPPKHNQYSLNTYIALHWGCLSLWGCWEGDCLQLCTEARPCIVHTYVSNTLHMRPKNLHRVHVGVHRRYHRVIVIFLVFLVLVFLYSSHRIAQHMPAQTLL